MSETIEVTFDVQCHECGHDLESSQHKTRVGSLFLAVEPCQTCLKKAREDSE